MLTRPHWQQEHRCTAAVSSWVEFQQTSSLAAIAGARRDLQTPASLAASRRSASETISAPRPLQRKQVTPADCSANVSSVRTFTLTDAAFYHAHLGHSLRKHRPENTDVASKARAESVETLLRHSSTERLRTAGCTTSVQINPR